MKVLNIKREEQTEKELSEKSRWVRNILSSIGLSTDNWAENLTMNDIRKIKSELKSLNIDIIDDTDNGLEIYYDNNLIAEWRRPRYVLRENRLERDPQSRYYLEMHINSRSVFDENEKNSSK
ncbi:MAG: hypothetical protein ACOYMA_00720 [Bacteroidia bacterium]